MTFVRNPEVLRGLQSLRLTDRRAVDVDAAPLPAVRRRSNAGPIRVPARRPPEVWTLIQRADEDDLTAAVTLADTAIRATVRAALPRMVADRPGESPGHDAITRTVVDLGKVSYRDARVRLTGVLSTALCVHVENASTRRVRLTGRGSDVSWAWMLHLAVEPVAERLLAEQWGAERPSGIGESVARQRAGQLTEFTTRVQRAVRRRFTAAQDAAKRKDDEWRNG